MSYLAMKRRVKCTLLSERTILKMLHTVWLQLYDILKKAKLWREHEDEWLPGSWAGGRMNKQSTGDI